MYAHAGVEYLGLSCSFADAIIFLFIKIISNYLYTTT